MKKLGVCMRAGHAIEYDESRDAIARDWYHFFEKSNLGFEYILLPNIGDKISDYAMRWGVDGVLLTGGDSLGGDIERDSTELSLLAYCESQELPVLGICRGAQVINHYLGGSNVVIDKKVHLATRHSVNLIKNNTGYQGAFSWNVNSYHMLGFEVPLPPLLEEIVMHNGECEAFCHKRLPWFGLMWHPEREKELHAFDHHLFNFLFESN